MTPASLNLEQIAQRRRGRLAPFAEAAHARSGLKSLKAECAALTEVSVKFVVSRYSGTANARSSGSSFNARYALGENRRIADAQP
jgi:hypothetical protein